jgi:hypothetical protein
MIPCKILNKIRQSELHTNRIVSGTLAVVIKTKNRMINREIHQIRERGFGVICSRISRGSRLILF